MDVAGKGWLGVLRDLGKSGGLESGLFWAAFLSNVAFLIIMRAGTIYGCAKCDVLLFMPINTVLNVFLSVVTGMVVLDEGRNVYSWSGVTFSMISVIGGIVMLVTGPAQGIVEEEHTGDECPADSTALAPTKSLESSRSCPGWPAAAASGTSPRRLRAASASPVLLGPQAAADSSDRGAPVHRSSGSAKLPSLDLDEVVAYLDWLNMPLAILRLNDNHQQAAASRSEVARLVTVFRKEGLSTRRLPDVGPEGDIEQGPPSSGAGASPLATVPHVPAGVEAVLIPVLRGADRARPGAVGTDPVVA